MSIFAGSSFPGMSQTTTHPDPCVPARVLWLPGGKSQEEITVVVEAERIWSRIAERQ